MAVVQEALAQGVHAVVRAVARQATSDNPFSTPTSTMPSATGFSLSSTATPSVASPTDPSSTSASPTPMSTDNSNNQQQSGATSSPLLFFVALGFGVVFTNLWIIVGVKYCFRYNARNRQMRGLDENGEAINMDNMPTRPHRRRREKKLMTMDEVNEKFPMMKYKSWVAARAQEGLPTAGGVSAPPSRAGSVRSVEGIVPEVALKEETSNATETRPDTSATIRKDGEGDATAKEAKTENTTEDGAALARTQTAGSILTKDPDRAHASDDEDDDEHINPALPPEMLATPGDSCAICIDPLEDDDDVRGLTCGHAFHAVCLDPWLTNRRACCPLCKADYYTPKPRPAPADGDHANPTSPHGTDPSRNNGRMNLPRTPQRTFGVWPMRQTPRSAASRRGHDNSNSTSMFGRMWDRSGQRGSAQSSSRPQRQPTVTETPASENVGLLGRLRGRIDPLRRGRGTSSTNAQPSPSQLEAGQTPSTNTAT
ncbi:ring-8 protein [Apiospora aurea]|uniref:Ring-8 protein n=1 Tax=Apiospora aurea TaxID=335848 RepID=A0ABR1QQU9_9PEZI